MVVTETIVIILINPKISLWSWCCLHSESKVSLFLSLVEILVKSERIKVSSLRKVILCDTKKCTFEAKFYWYSNFPLKYGTFLQNFNAEVRNISVSQKCPHFAKKMKVNHVCRFSHVLWQLGKNLNILHISYFSKNIIKKKIKYWLNIMHVPKLINITLFKWLPFSHASTLRKL